MSEPTYKPELPSAWANFNVIIASPICPVCAEAKPEDLTTHIVRRDWDRIISEIQLHLSLAAIAVVVHRTKPTVFSWKINGEPKESDARRLLALHAKYCGAPQ